MLDHSLKRLFWQKQVWYRCCNVQLLNPKHREWSDCILHMMGRSKELLRLFRFSLQSHRMLIRQAQLPIHSKFQEPVHFSLVAQNFRF